jgi:hypothetical protein
MHLVRLLGMLPDRRRDDLMDVHREALRIAAGGKQAQFSIGPRPVPHAGM